MRTDDLAHVEKIKQLTVFFFCHTPPHIHTLLHLFLILLKNQKPSAPLAASTWCQPGGIQSQKWYHEWCIRRKNAFTMATTQWAVVANTVMEKYEGYGDENILRNRKGICECCWGSTTEDITAAYRENPQYFYKEGANLSWSLEGTEQKKK